jgi:acetylornithine deacetylase/succinyl-diaminopimelate desuccinylase-like protein
MTKLDEFIGGVRPEFEAQLAELVGIPTVSADPAHRADIDAGARLAMELLNQAGLKAALVPTRGLPVVVASHIADPGYRTVTLYNHLDVQPADPAEWDAEPFKLRIEGDRYIGRGATDDKGPALTALAAIRYAIQAQIPLNFRVIWELEEEIGSSHFEEFMQARAADLTTDSVLISDTIWIADGKPAIPVGLRGLLTFEVTLTTGATDTHSGTAGGAARNPLGELAALITELYDAGTGQVKLPAFYDGIKPPTKAELQAFIDSGFTAKQFMTDHELTSLRTTDTAEVLERIMARPTFEVHGLTGGYSGPGVKTTIPHTATAKLSCRLVPGQNPERIFGLLRDGIAKHAPDATVTLEAAAKPYLADASGPYAKAAVTATEFAFGATPAFVREGGTIGAVLSMAEHLKAPVMMLGLSLPAHGYHAPNEYFDWGQASGGIKLFAKYFEEIAQL